MLQQDEMVMVMMMVLVVEMMMTMMMIPMKSSSMAVTMAMVSPSGREFPRHICSLQESFSLFVVFRPAEAAEYFSGRSPDLRFPVGKIYAKGLRQRWARVARHYPGAARLGPAPGSGLGPWWPTLTPPSGSLRHLRK